MRHTGQRRAADLCKTIPAAAASFSLPLLAIMYPISLFDCRCSQRGTFAEPSSMASGSIPREEPANLECSRVYESDTALVTIRCPSVAAVYHHCLVSLGAIILGMLWKVWDVLSMTLRRSLRMSEPHPGAGLTPPGPLRAAFPQRDSPSTPA